MNANTQMIETLASAPTFQEYEEAFTNATGLPLALRAAESEQLPLQGKRNESRWCAMMAANSATCAACLQMQKKLAQSAVDAPCTITCAYGLRETAVPVKVGTQTIGFLQTGQVLPQKPTNTGFERALETAAKLGVSLEKEKAREAYFATPVVPQKKLDSMASLLCQFADFLSLKSNQIAVEKPETHETEPPIVTRARQFIDEHHAEELTLGQVAQATNTSVFYFCKLFKKSTGLHFTEYVSRVRTERAKDLLLNPNLRVSEVAYEVGFQSLTHFNRVFKNIAGESPTEYRGHVAMLAA